MEQQQNSGARTAAAFFFDDVARRILAQHKPPDLRNIVVLLPNHHAAKPLALALMRAAQTPALLLPQMVTLNEWAQCIPLHQQVTPDSRSLAMLYQALQSRRWFGAADLWGMAQELLALFDELTCSLTELPRDADAFAAAVQQAYQARQNATLQFEARLVFELWHAMNSGSDLNAARAYQQRLAILVRQASQPLFVLRASDWNALEQRFLEHYAKHAAVTVCDLRGMVEVPGNSVLGVFSVMVGNGAGRLAEQNRTFSLAVGMIEDSSPTLTLPLERGCCRFSGFTTTAYSLRVQGGGDSVSLRGHAEYLLEQGVPPLGSRIRFFAANSLEEEARAASMQVRIWLNAGKRNIAIVAQDRVAARRMRALLERAEILVSDETGWMFATLSVSTVLMRWLDVLQSDFYHHDLLDLLKSPFIFADMAPAERKAVVYQLEQLLRKHGVVSGLEQFAMLAGDATVLRQPLARLRQAAALLKLNKSQSIAGWLAALHASLGVLGIDTGLQQDNAGIILLGALEDWQRELDDNDSLFRFAEWRRWLAQQLDTQNFIDASIDSPVRLTHLAATRWRTFDAVLLLGCDADHLPGVTDGGRWFNDAVRASLNLPTRSMHAGRQRDDLLALLMLNDTVLATWQKDRDGEAVLLSPYLEMLRDLHKLAYADDLAECGLRRYLAAEDARTVNLPQATLPAPQVPAQMIPDNVSVGAYNSLVACPYQFHARHILRLNELDEVQEAIEKRDYGERVHDILQRFHGNYPCSSGHPPAELEGALRQISMQVFGDLLEQDFAARAWLERWFAALPAYLGWQMDNEAQGWRYREAESAFDLELDGVHLRGRIDRLDAKEQEKRVLDYKLQGDQQLRDKLREPGEDVQLACYAYAHKANQAAFVSIESGKVKPVEPKHDVAQLARLNVDRLMQLMMRVRGGAGLPANGIDQACRYCEMRGVCRKGDWTTPPSPLAGEGWVRGKNE